MIDIVLIALLSALILAVIMRQIKVDGFLILPTIKDGKFQLNSLLYIIIGVIFGLTIIGQIYPSVNPSDALSILLGFASVFTAVYGANTIIDTAGTAITTTEES